MSDLTLATPERLTQVVEGLVMSASQKFELNQRMANRARQFFRAQIRAQRAVSGTPYPARSARAMSRARQGGRAFNTVNAGNMLTGFSAGLRTQVTDAHFAVGLTGVAGKIGRQHNEGSRLSFTTRVKGYYNSKVGRWEGGVSVKKNYSMPKRAFIEWTPSLERELIAMAAMYFTQQESRE
ncbi:phage virion morphogenesis protein [uncultured Vibrio sp.]|uniref:phage virion morphogenesis protein n=1 Tax=uncultured Vibrio sp. TaxID=114054 RepID=UPI002634DE70|nr:phage virion morphogenesis protein [uncultured Vibrio sp.]